MSKDTDDLTALLKDRSCVQNLSFKAVVTPIRTENGPGWSHEETTLIIDNGDERWELCGCWWYGTRQICSELETPEHSVLITLKTSVPAQLSRPSDTIISK